MSINYVKVSGGYVCKQEGSRCTTFNDQAESLWAEYLAWVAEGNTAEEWQPDGE